MNSLKIYLYTFISMCFWALAFVWYKDAFLSYGPVTIIFFRLIISVILLSGIAIFMKKKLMPEMRDFKLFVALAFFEPFCYFLGEGYGMQYVSPTTGAIIISTVPLLLPFFLIMFGKKEEISMLNFMGIVVSFAGIVMVIGGDYKVSGVSFKGVALLFSAVMSAIFFSVVLKDISKKYDSMVIVFWQNLLAALMFMPLFFILEFNSFVHSTHNIEAIIAVLKLGAFPSTVSFLLFIHAVSFIGVAKANTFVNLIPVMTALFSFAFYGEQFGVIKASGVMVVIVGLFISQIKMTNKKLERGLNE